MLNPHTKDAIDEVIIETHTFIRLQGRNMMDQGKPFRPDTKQTGALKKAGKAAAKDARRDSKAKGLSISFIKGPNIYVEHTDGSVEKIGQVTERMRTPDSIGKGTVLRRAR
jgi:hypothetical protein